MLPKVPARTAAPAIAGLIPASMRIGIRIAPTAAAAPAALGKAVLMAKVTKAAPGIRIGRSLTSPLERRLTRCLSHSVAFMT